MPIQLVRAELLRMKFDWNEDFCDFLHQCSAQGVIACIAKDVERLAEISVFQNSGDLARLLDLVEVFFVDRCPIEELILFIEAGENEH